jgi:hypothetical protein
MNFSDWLVGSVLYHKLANRFFSNPADLSLLQRIVKSAYDAGRKQGRKDTGVTK